MTDSLHSYSASIDNLQPNNAYDYRIHATMWDRSYYGDVETFTTSGPQVLNLDVRNLTSTTVTLWADIMLNGSYDIVSYSFEYGTSEALGEIVGGTSVGDTIITANVDDLNIDQSYFYTLHITFDNYSHTSDTARFVAPRLFSYESLHHPLYAGDIVVYDDNGDDFLDLLYTGQGLSPSAGHGRWGLFYLNSSIGHNNEDQTLIGTAIGDLVPLDLNRDNLVDLIMTGEDIFNNLWTRVVGGGGGMYEFTDVKYGSIAPCDFDNDGDEDVLLAGRSDTGKVTELYINNGTYNSVTPSGLTFVQVENGSAAWGDYDKDGYHDLLLTGTSDSDDVAIIYKNNFGKSFTRTNISLETLCGRNSGWVDFNSDGHLDIILGCNYVYLNNGDSTFSQIWTNPDTPTYCDWGDIDNDGDLDIVSAGLNSTVWHFESPNNFVSNENNALKNGEYLNIALGDMDNDSDLDIVSIGQTEEELFYGEYLKNGTLLISNQPSVPTELTTTIQNNRVFLDWAASIDDETQSTGLSYNVTVGWSSYTDIISPLSNLESGFRKISEPGNAGTNTLKIVQDLYPGTYYWSVQSVDNTYIGSPFAPIDSFQVPDAYLYFIPEQNMNEDDTLHLDFSYLNYSADAHGPWIEYDGEIVNITLTQVPDNEVVRYDLAVDPVQNWFGETDLMIYLRNVEQQQNVDSLALNISVFPVNDPPTPFHLIQPIDSLILPITYDILQDSIHFSWEASMDVESDPVFYSILFEPPFSGLSREGLLNAGAAQSISEILDYVDSTEHDYIELRWQVVAMDGADSTFAENGFRTILIDLALLNLGEVAITPEEYSLDQNYPNPFNPSTTIRYGLPENSDVSLVIYDVRGQVVQTLKSGSQNAGWYDVVWNGTTSEGKQISTGIYFARLMAGDYSQVIKMLYLK